MKTLKSKKMKKLRDGDVGTDPYYEPRGAKEWNR